MAKGKAACGSFGAEEELLDEEEDELEEELLDEEENGGFVLGRGGCPEAGAAREELEELPDKEVCMFLYAS